MNAIDCHAHAFPDGLAARAMATLEANCPWTACGAGTVSALIESMDAAGIDAAVVCAIATRPGQVGGILPWCQAIRSERIVPLPSVHPEEPHPARWVGQFAEAGFVGMKMHPMYQNFAVDDPALDELYAAAAEAGLFIAFHCGADIAYPPEDDRATPVRLARLNDKFPQLKLLCTHMGGWRRWDESERHLIGRDVYLGTSFSLGELSPDRAAEMIARHGVERVCFGTDWPWENQKIDLARLDALPLEADALRKIRFENAAKLLGISESE